MDGPPPSVVIAPQRFVLRKPQTATNNPVPAPVEASIQHQQPATSSKSGADTRDEEDAEILDEMDRNPDLAVQEILASTATIDLSQHSGAKAAATANSKLQNKSAKGSFPNQRPSAAPKRTQSQTSAAAAANPSPYKRSNQYIEAGLLDSSRLYGYEPDTVSATSWPSSKRIDRGRVPRSDGTYMQQDGQTRAYENSGGKYGREWLNEQLETKRALMRDPLYYTAFSVAGRTDRRVLDLIEDPLEFARPIPPEPEHRPSLKEARSAHQGFAWLPAKYSWTRMIEALDQRYRDALNKASDESQRQLVVIRGLTIKWNRLLSEQQDEEFQREYSPPLRTAPDADKQRYNDMMKSLRRDYIREIKQRLSELDHVALIQMTPQQFRDAINDNQILSELLTIEAGKRIPGAFEDLPGYELLRGIFEHTQSQQNSPNAALAQQAIDSWDALFNEGLLVKQRMLMNAAAQRNQTLERARSEKELFGRVVSNIDSAPTVQKPAVDTRWISLPEHLGAIFPKENLISALDRSMQDLSVRCGKGDASMWDLVTHAEVQSSFFDLVAVNLRLSEVLAHRRNEELRLLYELRKQRINLLLLFMTMEYGPGGELFFTRNTNLIKTGMRRIRESFGPGGHGAAAAAARSRRPLANSSGIISTFGSRDPLYTVYHSATETMDRARPLNGWQQLEYERSKEVFDMIRGTL